MRRLFLPLILSAAWSLSGEEIKMADGEVITFTSIKRKEPDGLVILTDSGVPKIKFKQMSEESQRQFGYDSAKETAFQDERRMAEINRRQQTADRIAEQEKHLSNEVSVAAGKETNNPQTTSLPAAAADEFNMALIATETVTEEIGIVGKKTLTKPPTVMGKSIYIEVPYWPTARAIRDEIEIAQKNDSSSEQHQWREWERQPNNWEAGAICTCTSMVLEHYGNTTPPREILQNASGVSYDPKQCTTDFYRDWWYDGVATALKNKGYQWHFSSLRKDHTQFQKDLQPLKDSLDKGTPAIVSVSIPPVDQYAKWHGVVVQGYDETKQAIYITDPTIARPGLRVLSYTNFQQIWHTWDCSDMRYIMYTSLRQ